MRKQEQFGVPVEMKYETYENNYYIGLLFSLNKHRFIKPRFSRANTFYYLVVQGRYIYILSSGNITSPVMLWNIQLVELIKGKEYNKEYNIINKATWTTPTEQTKRTIPILKDIEIPSCYSYPYDLFNKVYTKEKVDKLLKGGVDPALQK